MVRPAAASACAVAEVVPGRGSRAVPLLILVVLIRTHAPSSAWGPGARRRQAPFARSGLAGGLVRAAPHAVPSVRGSAWPEWSSSHVGLRSSSRGRIGDGGVGVEEGICDRHSPVGIERLQKRMNQNVSWPGDTQLENGTSTVPSSGRMSGCRGRASKGRLTAGWRKSSRGSDTGGSRTGLAPDAPPCSGEWRIWCRAGWGGVGETVAIGREGEGVTLGQVKGRARRIKSLWRWVDRRGGAAARGERRGRGRTTNRCRWGASTRGSGAFSYARRDGGKTLCWRSGSATTLRKALTPLGEFHQFPGADVPSPTLISSLPSSPNSAHLPVPALHGVFPPLPPPQSCIR